MWARDLWRLWCYRLCHLPKPPDKPVPPGHERHVTVAGSLNLTGIPGLPSEVAITVVGPHDVTVHHVFDSPLRVILEQAPPKLNRISLTLTSP